MGGCRCSYRNCTVRSDGQTHMFHYPVFDKSRCHQWLVNAHRLDFLNLKVSQLKNRVVCQNHFRDDCFMNYKKEKLKFEAVPTEDGPYCESDRSTEVPSNNMFPIVLDEIENDCLSYSEKRANFSVKYGDFLTNNDTDEASILEVDVNPKPKKEPIFISNNLKPNQKKITVTRYKYQQELPKLLKKPDYVDNQNNANHESNINVQLNPDIYHTRSKGTGQSATPLVKDIVNKETEKLPPKRKTPSVKVLSEQTIETPLPLIRKLESEPSFTHPALIVVPPVKQNFENEKYKSSNVDIEILNESHTNNDQTNASQENNNSTKINPTESFAEERTKTIPVDYGQYNQICIIENPQSNQNDLLLPSLSVEDITSLLNTKQVSESLLKPIQNENKVKPQTPPSTRPLRNKIQLERAEAIAAKRKMNKQKLSDMIEYYLEELEDDPKYQERNKQKLLKNTKESQSDLHNNNSSDVMQLSMREKDLSTIAALESRLQRMEEILLKKIEQNSVNILELKKSIGSSKSDANHKSESTQTFEDEEAHKRNLFNQLSAYLKPDTKSRIYEELFINKFVPKVAVSRLVPTTDSEHRPVTKRRRRI